jgi:hypothetical protein
MIYRKGRKERKGKKEEKTCCCGFGGYIKKSQILLKNI